MRQPISIMIVCTCSFPDRSMCCQAYGQPRVWKASFRQPRNNCRKRCAAFKDITNLHLFPSFSGNSRSNTQAPPIPRCRIPEDELNTIGRGFGFGNVPLFPYSIDLLPDSCNDRECIKANRLLIRHLEEHDIIKVLPEIVREFGSLLSLNQSMDLYQTPAVKSTSEIENFLFSLTILIGLTQRVQRRKKGYPGGDKSSFPDHNVICLVEQTIPDNNQNSKDNPFTETIVGIGEVSWQPPNPNRTAPPFVLPYIMKVLLAKFTPSVDEDGLICDMPRGYISNVLVHKNSRGLGYGKALMVALEGISRTWGCRDVSLHVDADENSGQIAQDLYKKLGYVGVPDRLSMKRKKGVGLETMDPMMSNQGLYVVDGVPLLYLRKRLD